MPLIFYLRNVQCRPFHPWLQTQVPFLHWPCSAQRASHGFWSHLVPVQSSLHLKIIYLSGTQTPNLFFFLQSIVTLIYVTLTFANLILTAIFRCHHIQLFIKSLIFFLRDKSKSAFEGSTYNSRPMFRRRPAQFLKKNALSFIVQMQNWFPPRGTLQESGKKTRIPASSELVLPWWETFCAYGRSFMGQERRGRRERRQL